MTGPKGVNVRGNVTSGHSPALKGLNTTSGAQFVAPCFVKLIFLFACAVVTAVTLSLLNQPNDRIWLHLAFNNP